MGLLSEVLLLPLAPVRGVAWVADKLADAAEKELRDPSPILARLAELNRALEDGEITSAEFEKEEEHLLDLLDKRNTAPVGHPQKHNR
ncbi:gas vesicle protein GvpG [Streptomyces sp. ACA25]|uniref:gas vesicle protein GvpG n=1 Tax=Streptomyces sp. ACA25 TaxID=3022596 RepID=UPI0023070C42|nr:gas vesicle protein GvpG [Streptomyces sp. ACA25]MDB1088203.1 gas vesicle protein GvpG [Streptomyces sp. ACA25]